MDKSKTIIAGTAALVALIGISGVAFKSFAADSAVINTNTTDTAISCPMHGAFGKNLSAEDKATFESKRAELDVKRAAMVAALDIGDYDAWVKSLSTDAPILTKINKDNFSKLVEAHKLQTQARSIFKELGIDGKGMMGGEGFGGRGGRMMGGRGLFNPAK